MSKLSTLCVVELKCSSVVSCDSCHVTSFEIEGQIFNRFLLPAFNICAGWKVSVCSVDSVFNNVNTEYLEGV